MRTVVKKKKVAKGKKPTKKKAAKRKLLPDLSNDPYFVNKAEEGKEILRRAGIIFE